MTSTAGRFVPGHRGPPPSATTARAVTPCRDGNTNTRRLVHEVLRDLEQARDVSRLDQGSRPGGCRRLLALEVAATLRGTAPTGCGDSRGSFVGDGLRDVADPYK